MLQQIKNYCWHLPKNFLLSLLWGFPQKKLTLIGVTGTDGKTTVTTLIHRILVNAGLNADLISTINSPGLHTTSPDFSVFLKLLRQMSKRGVTHVVIEATAHGLDQYRFFGCRFAVSVITNTSREHLDYFHDMTSYTLAKAKLFRQSTISILNADDPSYSIIKKFLVHPQTYSLTHPATFRAQAVKIDRHSLKFSVNHHQIITDSNYHYQAYNILAAFAVTTALKINPQFLIDTVAHFPQVAGRRQIVTNHLQLTTIVDFAHTPQALQETLSSLRQTTPGQLICLFGATGGRDPGKRPFMGQVVSQLADIAIITADDTRQEKVEDINQQIISGLDQKRLKSGHFRYYDIPNRQDAFNLAVKIAKPGDTIVACGKGHETSILHGLTEYPWSDTQAFKTAFRLHPKNV